MCGDAIGTGVSSFLKKIVGFTSLTARKFFLFISLFRTVT